MGELFFGFKISVFWTAILFLCVFLFTFHLKKKSLYIFRFLGSILFILFAQSVIFYLLYKLESPDHPLFNNIISCFFFLITVILLCCSLLFCYKISFTEAIFFTVAAYSLEHLSNGLKVIIFYFLKIGNITFPLIVQNFVFNIGFKGIVCFLIYFFLIRKYLSKYSVDEIIDIKVLIISIINLMICLVLSVFKGYGAGQEINSFTNEIICSIYAIFGCFLCLYLQFAYFIEIKLKNDAHMLDVLFKEQNKANQLSKENMELINIKFHDIKKQLRRLEEQDDDEMKKETVSKIKESLVVYDSFVRTGNGAIDSVLMSSYLTSLNKKIDFTYFIDGEVLNMFESTDIVSLFDNLLDNAFEAIEKEEEGNRIIHLQVRKEKMMVYIHIRNFCRKKPKFYHGLPVTARDPRFHGYGMKSIIRIVNKYDGNIKCSWKDDTFTLDILFPLVEIK
ncbi:MAG: GHKL domain-containing protein [Bacillales bacterium]|nr:GHKL domain-containing protein [Bacillales bacterium]